MANIKEMTYTFTNSTASSHFSKSGGMNLGQAGLVSNPLILWYSNSGTATMNATGKSFLYPKAGIHPFKADYTFILWNSTDSDFTSSPSSYMNFYFKIDGNTIYHKEVAPGKTSSPTTASDAITDDTNPAILNSTSSSSIVFEITAQKNGLTQMCGISSTNDYQCFIKFYYQQWDLTAQKVGDGWGTLLTPGRVYNGENVNYSYLVAEGCTFHGWYSDANHTNLISSSYIYNTTASQDLVLYPYVTKDTWALENVYSKTDFQLGSNTPGWFKPVHIWYKTLNGWEAQNNINNLNTGNSYRYSNNFIGTTNLANTSESYNFYYYPWSHGVLYIKNNNNYILTNLQGTTNLSFKHMQDGIVIQHDGTYYTGSQTVNISFKNLTDENWSTMTLIISLTVFDRDIQFQFSDGSRTKDKCASNSAYQFKATPGSSMTSSGYKELYCGIPTGRILEFGQSYWDVGWNNEIVYELANDL